MSDELRDDIAAVIVAMGRADPVNVAQAIIDEFELQVVEVDRIELTNGTVASYQIVGVWERCD